MICQVVKLYNESRSNKSVVSAPGYSTRTCPMRRPVFVFSLHLSILFYDAYITVLG